MKFCSASILINFTVSQMLSISRKTEKSGKDSVMMEETKD